MDDFGVFATPRVDSPELTVGTITGWFVSKASANIEEAKKFLDFWSQPDMIGDIQYKEQPRFSSFKDVKVELNSLLQDEFNTYINAGKVVRQYNDIVQVDTSELPKLYQDLLANGKTPKQFLEAWDKKFEELAKVAKLPGW